MTGRQLRAQERARQAPGAGRTSARCSRLHLDRLRRRAARPARRSPPLPARAPRARRTRSPAGSPSATQRSSALPSGRHEDARQVAALDERAARHPRPARALRRSARDLEPRERSRCAARRPPSRHARAQPAPMGDRIAAGRERGDLGRRRCASARGERGARWPIREPVRLRLGEARLELERVALELEERLARADQVARGHPAGLDGARRTGARSCA